MTKSPPAFPFTPHSQQKPPDGTWYQSYDPGSSGVSTRLWIATQLAAGDTAVSWSMRDVSDEMMKKRINLYYRIADVLIAGENDEKA